MAAFKRRAVSPPRSDAAGDAEPHFRIGEPGLPTRKDGARAAQYIQHVRALNTQFTSWVQQQLKEHPLILWKEGIQDYLRHASKIQDDFKDVITLSSQSDVNASMQSRPLSNNQNPFPNLSDGSTSSSFGKSWFEMKGGASVSQSFPSTVTLPFSKGENPAATAFPQSGSTGVPFLSAPSVAATPSFTPSNGTDTQEDDDAEPEPTSPSVKRSEEPGIKILHEVKCKLYTKGDSTSDGQWKDMGIGNLTLRSKEGSEKGTKESKATVLIRNEVGRVLLNALLYPNMKMNVQKNTVTGIFHSAETDIKVQESNNQETDPAKGRLYLIRLKTPSAAKQLVDILTSNAPRGD